MKYSAFSLAGEIARYLNISCILASKIVRESVDGVETILDAVNRYNEVFDDYVVPAVFHALYEVTSEVKSEDREVVLLREPKDAGYYEFSAKDDLVVTDHVIHFAAAKRHIGIYPGPEAVEHFAGELMKRGLKFSKGAIQIPYGDNLPLDLIAEISRWCGGTQF